MFIVLLGVCGHVAVGATDSLPTASGGAKEKLARSCRCGAACWLLSKRSIKMGWLKCKS